MSTWWKSEPARIMALAQALIALLVAFGVPLSQGQIAALLGIIAVLFGEITRSQVSSPATVATMNQLATKKE